MTHRHIDAAARLGEGGQIGGDHHGGDIAGIKPLLIVAGIHPQPLQHPHQGLAGEDGGAQPVTRAIQPDNKAIAHELVVAHTLDIGDVLDAHRLRRSQPREQA